MAYKRDVDDMRESPALDVIELLEAARRRVTYTDPFVPRAAEHGRRPRPSMPLDEALADGFDCAVIVTDHKVFDYPARSSPSSPLIVDTRNALKGLRPPTIFPSSDVRFHS